jgi:hypothetical protein
MLRAVQLAPQLSDCSEDGRIMKSGSFYVLEGLKCVERYFRDPYVFPVA